MSNRLSSTSESDSIDLPLRAMGMRPIVIDGGDKKRDLCTSLGAEAFIDFTKEKDVAGKVKEIADGIGAHGVLVTAYQAYNGTAHPQLAPNSSVRY